MYQVNIFSLSRFVRAVFWVEEWLAIFDLLQFEQSKMLAVSDKNFPSLFLPNGHEKKTHYFLILLEVPSQGKQTILLSSFLLVDYFVDFEKANRTIYNICLWIESTLTWIRMLPSSCHTAVLCPTRKFTSIWVDVFSDIPKFEFSGFISQNMLWFSTTLLILKKTFWSKIFKILKLINVFLN